MQLIDKDKLSSELIMYTNSDTIQELVDNQPVIEIDKSLRDEIAIGAMRSLIIHGNTKDRNPAYIAEISYSVADAMLIRRKLKNESN